jgi:membrane protease YdiL (CAAX protease family)
VPSALEWPASEPAPDGKGKVGGVFGLLLQAIAIFVISIVVAGILTVPFAIWLRPASGCDVLTGIDRHTCFHHRDLFLGFIIALQEVALLGTVLVWMRAVRKTGPRQLGFRRFTVVNVLIGVGVGLGGLVIAGIIGAVQSSVVHGVTHRTVEAPKQIPVSDSPGAAVLAIVGISVIVLAPLAEEAFFRGFLFAGLHRWVRPAGAVVLSAAVFGLAHLIPLIMLPIFGLGVVLASIVEARGSIVPSIFAHATFNTIGFIQLFVRARS